MTTSGNANAVDTRPWRLPLLFDSGEACLLLWGVDDRRNRYRLYKMIARDEIAGVRYGGRWYVPRAEMERLAAPVEGGP